MLYAGLEGTCCCVAVEEEDGGVLLHGKGYVLLKGSGDGGERMVVGVREDEPCAQRFIIRGLDFQIESFVR